MQQTDIVSEVAVLSAAINHGSDCYLDLTTVMNVDCFSDEHYTAIWKCLSEIYKGETKKADIPTILTTAKEIGLGLFFDTDEKLKTLKRVAGFAMEPENALRFGRKLRKLHITRTLGNSLEAAKKELGSITGNETTSFIIAKAEKPIFDTINEISRDNDGEGAVHISTCLRELIQHIEDNPGTLDGIPSGFPEWDEAIGGALAPGVHVIAARAKGGKSHICDNMGVYIAQNNIPVLIMDTEMAIKKHHYRLLSLLSGVKVNSIKKGCYVKNKSEVNLIRKAEQQLGVLPYTYIKAASMSMDERMSHIRRWMMRTVGYGDNGKIKPCVIFYDQLKVTDQKDISGTVREYQVLGFHMDMLNNFSIEYEVPIVALCQLNRDGINNESSSAVAGSDRIVQHCTSLTYLKWKSGEEIGKDGIELGNKKLVVVASRDGEGHSENGEEYIHVGTQLSKAKMYELGSTTRPKRMKEKFDVEQVEDIKF
jgi:replicative DNA helicase